MGKRIISTLLSLALLIGILPISATGAALAARAVSSVPDGYTGIYTAEDLNSVRNNLSGKYILMNDINLSSWGEWTPIGTDRAPFTGVFDGNGWSITDMNT